MSICFTGGAIGADTVWGELAEYMGHDVVHYIFDNHKSQCDNLVVLSEDELLLADEFLIKANEIVQRKFPSKSHFTNSLLRRNYYQIKDSDACYAVASLKNNKVSGGTAWAVAMFIQNRKYKPVYILNQDDSLWYSYDYNTSEFQLMDNIPPTPSGNWTGIGTRDISSQSIDRMVQLIEEDKNAS